MGHRFRFSMRTMLVVTTVVAITTGWLVVRWRIGQATSRAVETLHGLDAIAVYAGYDQRPESRNLKKLKEFLGYRHVEYVLNITSDEALAQLRGMKRLRRVSMSGKVTDKGLQALAQLTALEDIALNCPQVSHEGMACLAGLHELRSLDLSNSPIGDAGVKHLAALTKLKVLKLNGTGVTSQGMGYLRACLDLEELDLTRTHVGNEGLAKLAPLTRLSKLNIHQTEATLAGVVHLYVDLQGRNHSSWVGDLTPHRVAQVVVAHFEGALVRDDLVPYIVDALPAEPVHLRLAFTGVTAAGMRQLSRIPQLQRLTWEGAHPPTIEGFAHLQQLDLWRLEGTPLPAMRALPSLTTLRVGQRWFSERLQPLENVIALLQATPSLTSLHLVLDGEDEADPQLTALSNFPQLRKLDVYGAQITARGAHALAALGQLEWLHLGGSTISDEHFAFLESTPLLQYLNLRHTSVSDGGLVYVAKLPHLREIDLTHTKVTRAGIDVLRQQLPQCRIKHWEPEQTQMPERELSP